MNVALNKAAANHPGTLNQYIAMNAVDGKTGPFSVATCSHTSWYPVDEPDWWTVDLGDSYVILGIQIYTRERSSKLHNYCHQ